MTWTASRTIRRTRSERGVAIVELAIALPILLIVMLGIVEFGRVLVYWNDTTQISSIGARWAVVNRWPGKDGGTPLQDAIQNDAGFTDFVDNLVACVEFVDTDGDGVSNEIGDAVRIRTIFTFEWNFLPSWVDVADREIVSHATMRIENVPEYDTVGNDPACP